VQRDGGEVDAYLDGPSRVEESIGERRWGCDER
jgi:hypothetical protein